MANRRLGFGVEWGRMLNTERTAELSLKARQIDRQNKQTKQNKCLGNSVMVLTLEILELPSSILQPRMRRSTEVRPGENK